jgi:hypothetical protein
MANFEAEDFKEILLHKSSLDDNQFEVQLSIIMLARNR